MLELFIANISTVFEPSTTVSATAEFAGFLVSSAFGTYGTDHC